jgi:hypothetical protein
MLCIQTSRSVSTYIWSSLDPYIGISSIQWAKLAKTMAPVARDSQPRPKTQDPRSKIQDLLEGLKVRFTKQ